MRHVVIGTAGHIDHGKTALVRALTGIDTDRLEEERRRGITIDLGFAELAIGDDVSAGIVDVPGHEAFIRNMLAGATGIDLALLVVAADEGMMPQTREHLAIVELLGIRGAVIAVTKTDLVERAWLDLVVEDLSDGLAGTAFAHAPIVPVSARDGRGLESLTAELARAAAAIPERHAADLFRMPVDRVFTVHGTGTVVTGTIWSGTLRADSTVRVLPAGLTTRVRRMESHGRVLEEANPGRRVALALAGVDRSAIRRGDVVVVEPAWAPAHLVTTRLRLLPTSPWPLAQRQRVRFHLGTSEVMGRVVLLGRDGLDPGQSSWAQLRLEAPIVARHGDRFVLRSYSPVTTIGGGTIVEPQAKKRRRADTGALESLAALGDGDSGAAERALAAEAGWSGIELARLPILIPPGLSGRHQPGASLVRIGDRGFAPEIFRRAREQLLRELDAYHTERPLAPAAPREVLRRALPRSAPAALADHAIASLLSDAVVQARHDGLARAGFDPRLSPRQQEIREAIATAVENAEFAPPRMDELPAELRGTPDFEEIVRLLELDGRIVRIASEIFLARSTLERGAQAIRSAFAGRSGLGPADFRRVLPVSRKFLIPLLEYYDGLGVTRREGGERSVPPPAAPERLA